jgi:iron complex outermembrane receptor protein
MRHPAIFFALALSLALALPAMAAEPAAAQDADNATRPAAARSGRLQEVLVTATSHEARVDMVPDAVSVVTREQIDQMVAPTAIDILKNIPGVEVYSARGPLSSSTYNRVMMRGQGAVAARILVLLNGVPQSGGQSGEFEWNFINPRDIERIEVVRGPGSALYGSQAMGGVINIITRKPTSQKGETTLEGTYGTLNTVSTSLSHSQKAGNWGFYGSGTLGGTQGYRVANEVSLSGGQPTNSRNLRQRNDWGRGVVTYDFDDAANLSVNVMHGHFVNRGTYDYAPEFKVFDMSRKQGDMNYSKRFEGGTFSAYTSVSYQDSTYDNYTSASKKITGKSPANQWDYQGGMKTSYDLGSFNTVSVGLDFKRTTYDRRNDNFATGTDAYGSSGGDSWVYGAFAQDELKLFDGRVIITPGIRYEYTSLFDGYSELREAGVARRDVDRKILSAFTSRLGARYNATDWISFRTAYGESFRAPTLHELYGVTRLTSTYLGNDALKPERLKSIEAGADITPLDNLRLSLTVYKNHATDYIDNVSQGGGVYKRQNIGTVDTGGVEAEVEYRFLEFWRSFVNYQRCDPKLMSGPYSGQRISGTPLSTTSAGVTFNNPDLFMASLVNRWVGKIFYSSLTTYNNTTAYGKYDVMDAKLAKTFKLEASKLELSLSVSNLLDVHVQETSGTEAPGRLVTAGVAWIF